MGPIPQITTVSFIGAGTMGCVNSLVAAVSGYDAVLYDIDPVMLESAADRQQGFADYMVSTGYCSREQVIDGVARIRTTTDPESAAATDLISESVAEVLEVKRAVHHQFDGLCPPRTILTTNTSALLVSDIDDAVERGDRFAALHSYLGSPLIDIVGGPHTTPATIDLLRRYVLSLGGVPLVLRRENPGYIVNSLLGPFLISAAQLVARGDCDVEAVDRAWMTNRGAPMGPFAMMDLFGFDVVTQSWENATADDTPHRSAMRSEALTLLKPLMEGDKYGVKSGRGFYEYPDPSYQHVEFLDQSNSATAYDALVAAVTTRAILLAKGGIADLHDIDRAWMVATSQDIGPFGLIDDIGPPAFRKLCAAQVASGLASTDETSEAIIFLEEHGNGFYDNADPVYRHANFLRSGTPSAP